VRAIIGIGNPGSSYQFNKHNAGFLLIDYFAKLNSINFIPSKYSYYQSTSTIDQTSYVLIKPTTYVNESGIAAAEVINNFKLSREDLLVVCDDVYLDLGSFKAKLSGGDGGHNGLSSIIYQQPAEFLCLRAFQPLQLRFRIIHLMKRQLLWKLLK